MNIADELGKVRDKLDSVIAWVSGQKIAEPFCMEKAPRRLKTFILEYGDAFGTQYQVRNAKEESSAAKRTETKANDAEYLAAVRTYLSDRESSFGAPYFSFIGKFDHWLKISRGKKGTW